jgi:hypothetical protein
VPAKDRKVKSATWTRWWKRNKAKHLASVRKNEKKKRAELRKFIDDYKLARGCRDCGFDKHPAALDFNHRDAKEKEFHISVAFHRVGRAKLMREIEKCDVVCANCHRIQTAQDRELRKVLESVGNDA